MRERFALGTSVDEGAFDRLRASIDPAWIEEALEATGTATLRRRRLPAEQVIWLVLGMALYRHRPIDELVERLDLVLPGSGRSSVAKSAVAQARARLGEEPLQWLFERCSEKWGHESARRHEWRGLAVYGVDGTSVRIPDSPDNRGFFGGHCLGEKKGASGYPLARIVTLMALRSHLIVTAAVGPYGDERPMAATWWPKLPDNSLAIVDRNFLAANILLPIERSGEARHWLTRAKSISKWKVLKKLGVGDELVEVTVSDEARRKNPVLPKYPAKEIRDLYHERWELELGFDEVKTDMLEREEAIRSRTPPGAMQELWAIGLVYNLVRLEMEQVVKEAAVPPSRVSFVMSLRLIRDEWMWAAASRSPGAIPANLRRLREELKRFVLPPRRSARSFPRAVKLKMSNYARKRPTTAPK